jgi:AraC-like DNA-binding protein
VLSSLIGPGGAAAEIAHPVIDDPALFRALQRLFRRFERWRAREGNRATEMLACEEALVETVVLLVARHGTVRLRTETPDCNLRCLRELLADAPLDPPSLAEMAAMTGLSRYQVLRRFERSYGLPPHAWLLCCRAGHALRLIRAGETLIEAAAASGFADQSHMTRVFARHYGFTPGAWRKAVSMQ